MARKTQNPLNLVKFRKFSKKSVKRPGLLSDISLRNFNLLDKKTHKNNLKIKFFRIHYDNPITTLLLEASLGNNPPKLLSVYFRKTLAIIEIFIKK